MRDDIRETIKKSPEHQVVLNRYGIEDSDIDDIMRVIMQSRPNLRQLFISQNKIGDNGAKAIAGYISKLENFEVLSLQQNKIDVDGIKALAELTVTHPNMKLHLHGNKLSNTGDMRKIMEDIKDKKNNQMRM